MAKHAPVGLRELKNATSEVLRRVRRGEIVTVTDRGRAIARLVPVVEHANAEAILRELVRAGRIAWGGGKPVGAGRPVRVRGASVASAVVEDRR